MKRTLAQAEESTAVPATLPKRPDGRANAWNTRVWDEYAAGNLTRAYRDVLLTLRRLRGREGIFPCHATIAATARCSVATVKRALDHARKLQILDWMPRYRPGTKLRSSNRYFLCEQPTHPVTPGNGPVWPKPPPLAQTAPGSREVSKKAALQEMLAEAAAAPDLLARARERSERLMAERYRGRYG